MNLLTERVLILGSVIALSAMAAPGDHDSHSADEALRPTAAPSDSSPHDSAASAVSDEEANTRRLERLFDERPEIAAAHEKRFAKAIEREDEADAAELTAYLVHSRNADQKKAMVEALKKDLDSPEVKASPKQSNQVRRLLWAVQGELGEAPGRSSIEAAFRKELEPALAKAREAGAKFHENLEKAADGDEAAKKYLLDHYSTKTLMDYLAAQKDYKGGKLSSRVAEALGWKDQDGVTHLDVVANGNGHDPDYETWTLGKKPEEIAKAIQGIDAINANEVSHDPAGPSRFRDVSLAQTPVDKRKFFKLNPDAHRLEQYAPRLLLPEDRQLCAIADPTKVKEVPTDRVPNYFFRPFPSSDRGSYASSNHNFILDLSNGHEISMPGSYDPVPTPDELYMTIPADDQADPAKGLTFFSMNDLLHGRQKPLFVDPQLKGVYQSIGTVSKEASSAVYRVITDQDGLSFRDYKLTRLPGGEARVEPGPAPKRLCPGLNLSLPMLSKDGRQVAALDVDAQVSKIFDIDPATGKCTEALNLGVYTGKIDFNFNNDEITFHKFNNDAEGNHYFKVPSDDLVSNVYVYKRSTGELKRITRNTDSNSVYPAFRRDGKIVYLHHPHHGDDGATESATLVVADPEKAPSSPFDFFENEGKQSGPGQGQRLHSLTALGALWSNLCSPYGKNVSTEASLFATIGLDKDRCQSMVKKYWDSFKDEVIANPNLNKDRRLQAQKLASLSQADLLQACPTSTPDAPAGSAPTSLPPVEDNVSGAPVPDSCAYCHAKFPWNKPNKLRAALGPISGKPLVQEILRRINLPESDPEHMPKGGRIMTADEKQKLEDYLKAL